MDAVLGIDPAWTVGRPSGVALLTRDGTRWRCRGVAPSYESFIDLAQGRPVEWHARPTAGAPNVARLLDASRELAPGARIEVVTVDMPVAVQPFTSRRPADDVASKVLGRLGCAVHSPTHQRPGLLGRTISTGFATQGFDVYTGGQLGVGRRPLLEVYPHPAAISLLETKYRVPYKVAKSTTYWPATPVASRVGYLLDVWSALMTALADSIDGVELPLPSRMTELRLSHLKRFEDALDAVICAWVGARFLAGECVALGDGDAAI